MGAILSLFGVCLAAAMAEMLLPGEGDRGVRGALRVLCSLAVLVLILRPVPGLLSSAEGIFGEVGEETEADFSQALTDAVSRQSAHELTEGLYALLERDFSLAREDCRVSVAQNEQGALTGVTVLLAGKGLLCDPDEIEAALSRLLDGEVEVR